MKDPSIPCKRLLLTNFIKDWRKDDFWPPFNPPTPFEGQKGSYKLKKQKVMKDPKKNLQKGFFPPNLVNIGAKMNFYDFL